MRTLIGTTPLFLAILAGCEYEAPVDGDPIRNVITGSVLFGGPDPSNAVVTAFDFNNPPPPAGTGSSPINADGVGKEEFTGDGAGIQAGEFALSGLPDGDYLISSIMDVDGDFNPFASVLTGATCGDWLALHTTDLGSGIPAPVHVEGGEWVEDVTAVYGIELTLERPVFELVTPTYELGKVVLGQAPPFLRLRTAEVATAFSPDFPLTLGPACDPDPACEPGGPTCGCFGPSIAECGTALFVRMTDADLDGVVDPYPSEAEAQGGLLDIWPRVFIEYVGPEVGTFTIDGVEKREKWQAQAFPMALEIFTAAGQAGGLPPAEGAALLGPVGQPFPVNELSLSFFPKFRHVHADGKAGVNFDGPYDLIEVTPEDDGGVPGGTWQITVISFTGQTWRIPNEIASFELPTTDPNVDMTGQGIPLEIVP